MFGSLHEDRVNKVVAQYNRKLLREDSRKDIMQYADPRIRARVKRQGIFCRYQGMNDKGEMLWKVKSGTIPGHFWSVKVRFKNVDRAIAAMIEKDPKIRDLQITRALMNGDIEVDCNDPSFLYWGWKYRGTQRGYSIEAENRAPKRNLAYAGTSVCFIGETLVAVKGGFKRIDEIRVGDEVLTHQGRYKKVLEVGRRTPDKVLDLKAGYNRVGVTEEHPFYVFSNHSLKWRLVVDLARSDFGVTPQLKLPETEEVPDNLAFMLGLYLSDGYIAHQNYEGKYKTKYPVKYGRVLEQLRVSYNSDHEVIYRDKFRELGFEVCSSYLKEGTKTATLHFKDKELMHFLAKYSDYTDGLRGRSKGVSLDVLNWNSSAKKSFLLGFFWGDGTLVAGSGRGSDGLHGMYATFYNTNEQIMGVVNQLLRCFVPVRYNWYQREPFFENVAGVVHEVKPKKMYYARLTGAAVSWLVSQDPRVALIKGEKNKNRNYRETDRKFLDGFWVAGKLRVVGTRKVETVYSLSVEDDETYLVTRDMLVVHNCKHIACVLTALPFYSSKIVGEFRSRGILPNRSVKKDSNNGQET